MSNSINTNISAYFAQSNIGKASTSASGSIARLSSGNRIVRASDDVAGLSVGTSLRTGVSSLRIALVNANQGSSLLQVADGGLAQVTDILQRQKSIAVQANSGTLSATERSYLNQEFQALRNQIDQIAGSTTFSSVKLLDGSLSGSKAITTNVADSTGAAVASAGAIVTMVTVANNDVLNIAGMDITFTSSALGSVDAAGKVVIGANATETAENLVNFLNTSADARFSNYKFTNAAGAVSANWTGGRTFGGNVVAVTSVTGTNFTVGNLANRTIAAVPVANDGLSVNRVSVVGQVTGSLLANGATGAVRAGQAFDLALVEDNKNFIGKFGGDTVGKFTGTFNVANFATLSLKVGNITYTTPSTDFSTSANQIVATFTGRDEYGTASGGSFTLSFDGAGIGTGTITSQGTLDPIIAQLNEAVSGITLNQNRDVTSFQEGEIVTIAGVQVGNLDGLQANMRSSDFANVNIESVKITAPEAGGSDARFEVVINGETFVSKAGLGNQIGLNTVIALQSTTSTKAFTLVTGNAAIATSATTALDLGTQAKADAIAKALEKGFGLGDGSAKLNFQVGAQSTDTIGVKVDSIKSSALYGGQNLDISTQAGAQAASIALDAALVTVTKVRADVGALQSRLGFTSANLQTSIQNQDAARATLLDTDVAAESTMYATAQVQLQAGISVLAQANQLPQNLLKLIG